MSRSKTPLRPHETVDYNGKEFYLQREEGRTGRKYSSLRSVKNLLETRPDIHLTPKAQEQLQSYKTGLEQSVK